MSSPAESVASIGIADLDVNLDHPNRRYAPGDNITGSVCGWKPAKSGDSLVVSLQGRGRSTIASNKCHALLLYQTSRLEASDFTDSQIARFSLSIPTSVEADPSETAKKITDDISFWKLSWPSIDTKFENEGGHRLPPSMTLPRRQTGDSSPVSGYIKYMVTATASYESQVQGGQVAKKESYPEPVYISGPAVTADEVQRLSEAKQTINGQLFIERKSGPEKKSFRWYVRSKLHYYPMVFLAPEVKIPRQAIIGEDIQISIQLQPSRAYYGLDMPPFSLHRVTANLCDVAGVRGKSILGGTCALKCPGSAAATKTWTTKHLFKSAEDNKSYQIAPCEVAFKVPHSCIPTFKTYNMSIRWQIVVEMVFRGLDDKKKVEVSGDIDLIPRLKGITTDEEPEDDALELEAPPGAQQSGQGSDSDGKGAAGDLAGSLWDTFSN